MSLTDYFILAFIGAGAFYGILRGLRAALYLLVTFLAVLLAVILFTDPLERLILDLSGVGSANYPGAPAVAVLLLEDRTGMAYLAAAIPSLLTFFGLLALVTGGALLGRYLVEASRSAVSRISGFFCGIFAGAALSLLFTVQLMRLPWPPAGRMFEGSLIISALNLAAQSLLPALAGGV